MGASGGFDEAAAIAEFRAARGRGEHFPRAWFDRLSLDQAYRIQLGLIARRAAEEGEGARQVGWKVGLTAKPIQQQFGFHEPVFGCLLAEGRIDSGHVFPPGSLVAPGFETELCLVLGAPLSGPVDAAAARAAIAAVHPALEIIETRGDFTAQIAVAIADNAQQKAFVLGPGVPFDAAATRLDRVEARVAVNGAEVARGRGEAVLGDPVNSLVWLSGKLAQYGRALRAGDYVMSGSFVRQFPLAGGDRVEAVFEGIGAVRAAMG
jgi:2-keto-4-pentenoate hydratase